MLDKWARLVLEARCCCRACRLPFLELLFVGFLLDRKLTVLVGGIALLTLADRREEWVVVADVAAIAAMAGGAIVAFCFAYSSIVKTLTVSSQQAVKL